MLLCIALGQLIPRWFSDRDGCFWCFLVSCIGLVLLPNFIWDGLDKREHIAVFTVGSIIMCTAGQNSKQLSWALGAKLPSPDVKPKCMTVIFIGFFIARGIGAFTAPLMSSDSFFVWAAVLSVISGIIVKIFDKHLTPGERAV